MSVRRSLIGFCVGLLVAIYGAKFMFPAAFAQDEVSKERVPVLAMQLDGGVVFKTVKLPRAPNPLIMHVCIQEFEATAIACYAINTATFKWERFDLTLQP